MVEKTLEMRGMRRKEIVDYFSGLKDIKGVYVEVGEESFVSQGAITLSSIVVIFRGEATFVEATIAQFRLRFLSAGG